MKQTKSSRHALRVPVSLIGQVFLAISVAQARNDAPPGSERAWLSPGLFSYENALAEAAPTPEDYLDCICARRFPHFPSLQYHETVRCYRCSPTIFHDYRDRLCSR